MSEQRYMVMRKGVCVWVPVFMWSEVQGIFDLDIESIFNKDFPGFTRFDALRIINANRDLEKNASVKYRMVPIEQFISEELQ